MRTKKPKPRGRGAATARTFGIDEARGDSAPQQHYSESVPRRQDIHRLVDFCLDREDYHAQHLRAAQVIRAELEALIFVHEQQAGWYRSIARHKRRQALELLEEARLLEQEPEGQT